jgi:hypothetical protein
MDAPISKEHYERKLAFAIIDSVSVANSQYEGIRQFGIVLHTWAAMIRFAPCATS